MTIRIDRYNEGNLRGGMTRSGKQEWEGITISTWENLEKKSRGKKQLH